MPFRECGRRCGLRFTRRGRASTDSGNVLNMDVDISNTFSGVSGAIPLIWKSYKSRGSESLIVHVRPALSFADGFLDATALDWSSVAGQHP